MRAARRSDFLQVLADRGVSIDSKEQADRLGNAVANLVEAAGSVEALADPPGTSVPSFISI